LNKRQIINTIGYKALIFLQNFILVTRMYERLLNLLYFAKHYKSILQVTKYYANFYNNKKGTERLNNDMNNCV
jgi:hypothetical protein